MASRDPFEAAASLGTTPELDSLFLFGGGLASLGAYALMRLRGRRHA